MVINFVSNKPLAMIAARISDIAPNGRATRVTYGVFNLTHRDSHEEPEELEPGREYTIRFSLNHVAQRFPAGHQIRLSVSTSYWPLAWPSPEPARLTIKSEKSGIRLPLRRPRELDANLRSLGEPQKGESLSTTLLVPAQREWKVIHNLATNKVSLEVVNNDAQYRIDELNLELQKDVTETYSYRNNNYDTLRGEVVSKRSLKRDNWQVSTITRTLLTSTRTHFRIRASLDAYEEDTRIFSKSWDESIARDSL